LPYFGIVAHDYSFYAKLSLISFDGKMRLAVRILSETAADRELKDENLFVCQHRSKPFVACSLF
jgi:hypothetical protein